MRKHFERKLAWGCSDMWVSGIREAKQQVGKSRALGARWLGCESWLSHLMVIEKLFNLSVPQFLHLWNGFLWGVNQIRHIKCLGWWLAHSVRNYYIPFILNLWVNLKFKIKFVLENPSWLLFQDDWARGGWIKEHRDTSDVCLRPLCLKIHPPFFWPIKPPHILHSPKARACSLMLLSLK